MDTGESHEPEPELRQSAFMPSRPRSKLVLPRLVRLRDAAIYLAWTHAASIAKYATKTPAILPQLPGYVGE